MREKRGRERERKEEKWWKKGRRKEGKERKRK